MRFWVHRNRFDQPGVASRMDEMDAAQRTPLSYAGKDGTGLVTARRGRRYAFASEFSRKLRN
jgi:hypothetical protein